MLTEAGSPEARSDHEVPRQDHAGGIGDALARLRKPLAGRKLPLSGYATAVDWSASAALEFLYFDLVLGRGFAPARAAAVVRKELACAGDEGAQGSPFGGLKFRFSE